MSVQSLNGDSYQGAQVGANVQSQVGARVSVQEPSAVSALPAAVQRGKERERDGGVETNLNSPTKVEQRQPLLWGVLPTLGECVGSGLSVTQGRWGRSRRRGDVAGRAAGQVFCVLRAGAAVRAPALQVSLLLWVLHSVLAVMEVTLRVQVP